MSLIAVDIGNSRIKLGHFAAPSGEVGLPTPTKIISVLPSTCQRSSSKIGCAIFPTVLCGGSLA